MDMTCYCGHDCSKCKVYLATLSGDAAMREESLRFYKEQMNLDIPPERMLCHGGRSDEIMEACQGCPFAKCCKEKGIHSCAECTRQCKTFRWHVEKYVNQCNQL